MTGFDFSAAAVGAAQDLAQRGRLDAEFLQADVYDAIDAIGGRTFDVVYTGNGAIRWLPDLNRWAAVMAQLLVPGGRFYMAEFHPFASVFAPDELVVVNSYFDRSPHVHTTAGSYADPNAYTTQNTRVTWNHPLGTSSRRLPRPVFGSSFSTSTPTRCGPAGRSSNATWTARTACPTGNLNGRSYIRFGPPPVGLTVSRTLSIRDIS